jgi:hypothetical protein
MTLIDDVREALKAAGMREMAAVATAARPENRPDPADLRTWTRDDLLVLARAAGILWDSTGRDDPYDVLNDSQRALFDRAAHSYLTADMTEHWTRSAAFTLSWSPKLAEERPSAAGVTISLTLDASAGKRRAVFAGYATALILAGFWVDYRGRYLYVHGEGAKVRMSGNLGLAEKYTSQRKARGLCEICGQEPAATVWAGTGQVIEYERFTIYAEDGEYGELTTGGIEVALAQFRKRHPGLFVSAIVNDGMRPALVFEQSDQ